MRRAEEMLTKTLNCFQPCFQHGPRPDPATHGVPNTATRRVEALSRVCMRARADVCLCRCLRACVSVPV
eukprot:10418110-Alexandrium_andersonii.AAC.1